LDCPASSITESAVDETLARRGARDGLVNELRELFQLCNQARYAPVRGSTELKSIAALFEKVSKELAEVNV